MFLEALTLGALVYAATWFQDKVSRPPINIDIFMQPLDLHRLAPSEPMQSDVVHHTARQMLKDKVDVYSEMSSPQDVALDLIHKIQPEYYNAPPPYEGKEALYLGEEGQRQYIPLNLDV